MSSSPPSVRNALWALLGVQLLFGTLPVAGKIAMPVFGAGGIGFFRIVGGALVFQMLRLLLRQASIPWRDQPKVFICGMLGITANQLFYLYGLRRTTAVNATLIVTLVPVLTYGAALLLGREKWENRRIAGILLGVIGVGVLVSKDVGGGEFIGDMLVFANVVSYSLYLVLSRPLLEKYPPLSVVAWLFTWSLPVTIAVVGLPVFPPLATLQSPPHADFAIPVWLAIAYLVAGPTVGTYYLNLYALRSVSSSTVALFVYLQPFITTAAAVFFLGETPGIRTAISASIAFAGVWLAGRSQPPVLRHPS